MKADAESAGAAAGREVVAPASARLFHAQYVTHRCLQLGIRCRGFRVTLAVLHLRDQGCFRVLGILVLGRDVLERRADLLLVGLVTVHAAFCLEHVRARLREDNTRGQRTGYGEHCKYGFHALCSPWLSHLPCGAMCFTAIDSSKTRR